MKIKYPYEYDPRKRVAARLYTKKKIVQGIVNGLLVPVAFLAFMVLSGAHIFIRDVSTSAGSFYIPVYVFILLSLLAAIQLPLRFYSGYVFEHKYKLSNQSFAAWLKDMGKFQMLAYIFFVPLLSGLYLLMPAGLWWLYAGIAYFTIIMLVSYIFPVIVLPLFYKIGPYKDNKHKSRLMKIAHKEGINIGNIVVVKESSRSKKANAMFLGLGNTKKIALFDTLINNFTKDETETVVAHELGHYVNKDILMGAILDAIKILPIFIAINFILKAAEGPLAYDISSLPLFIFSFMLIDFAMSPAINAYSRKREAAADLYALDAVRKPKAQISAEKRLCDMNLADDRMPRIAKLFFASHPTAEERIKMCEEWRKKNKS